MKAYILNQIYRKKSEWHDNKLSKYQAGLDNGRTEKHIRKDIVLSVSEKYDIANKWSSVVKFPLKRGYNFYLALKCLDHFDANYLPPSYFYPVMERILNPEKWKRYLCHKSIFELAYKVGVKHPETVLRSYGGVLLDSEYRPLLKNDAIDLISSVELPLLFKPSVDTIQGNGIELYNGDEIDGLLRNLSKGIETDFVVQKLVCQSEETKHFNPSSLNCFRVTTLNLNGVVSVCSRALKCGPKNSVVDNIGSGRRGVIVGVNPDGSIEDKGFYGNGDIATSHNGVDFKGVVINHYPLLEEAAITLHKYIDKCKIIGWDLALDSDNNPILIEGNVVYPGIGMEQLCSGPIFGERTDEVVEFIKSRLR